MDSKVRIRALFILLCSLLCLAVVFCFVFSQHREPVRQTAMGGAIHAFRQPFHDAQPAMSVLPSFDSTRFQRPSARAPLENPFAYPNFENKPVPVFSHSQDVVLAYWGILEDASNMEGFSGGCGTIGNAGLPYPYAYQLLTPDAQKRMPLQAFIDSFAGYGHINLLALYPAYAPPDTPPDTAYYMVELESITGRPETDDIRLREPGGSLFAYHYGLITVKNLPDKGWKIEKLDFIPEDFLCAPYHGWSYDATLIVDIVLQYNQKVVEKIEKTVVQDNLVTVSASGHGQQYRFVFVRLANGYDILLHQYLLKDGQWKEVNLLTKDWDYFLFAPDHLD